MNMELDFQGSFARRDPKGPLALRTLKGEQTAQSVVGTLCFSFIGSTTGNFFGAAIQNDSSTKGMNYDFIVHSVKIRG